MMRRRSKCYSAQQTRLGYLVPVVIALLCISSSGRVQAATADSNAVDAADAAQLAANMAAVQQQQQRFMTVLLGGVSPLVETRYTWKATSKPNVRAIKIPVDSQTGWPEVRYKVTYNRSRDAQTVYTLSGQVTISTKDEVASAINVPRITVTTNLGNIFRVPESGIQCPTLVVPATGKLTCTFAASYAGRQPVPGTFAAAVDLAGVLIPITLDSAPVPYDFSTAEVVETGAFGTASNFFELGTGIIQPYGVYGEQPPPDMKLEDSRDFAFIAVFGNVPSSKCGGSPKYKAVNTAELVPSSSDPNVKSPTQSAQSTLQITLTGCEGPALLENTTPAPTLPTVPTATPTPPTAVGPPPPVAPPVPENIPSVPGVTFAEAGSTLCGTGVCPTGQRCFDGWNCCPEATPICGAKCCQAPSVCLNNRCVEPGSVPCGTTVCEPAQTCGLNNVCCTADRKVCGTACCEVGQDCVLGTCAAAGSVACGATAICTLGQTCVSGVCCNTGETACGGRCCPAGNECLQGQFCAPIGSTLCGAGQICNAPQQCAGGMVCCDAGATFCAGACCPGTNQCQANTCLAPGQVMCGTTVCGVGQTCQGGTVCCDATATFCNNACCPNGNTCVNNQCVPQGSTACGPTVCQVNTICGNPQTGLCCQAQNQFGCGTACCDSFTQVCDQYRQICTLRFNNACVAGQIWCPGAQQCCPIGTICTFNQCTTVNAVAAGPGSPVRAAFGGRRLHAAHL